MSEKPTRKVFIASNGSEFDDVDNINIFSSVFSLIDVKILVSFQFPMEPSNT